MNNKQLATLILAMFLLSRLLLWVMGQFGAAATAPGGLCQWDCSWYLSLASEGYTDSPASPAWDLTSNWAYFPLYPLLLKLVQTLSGLSYEHSGILLSNLLVLLATWVGSKYLLATREQPNLPLFVGLMLLGPFSFYFATVYTEALFVVLLFMSLLSLQKQQDLQAGIAAALLSATRATGVFWVLGYAVHLLQRYRSQVFSQVLREPKHLLILVLAPLGLFLYMAYQYQHVGDALAFKHVQTAWGRGEFRLPFLVIFDGLKEMDLGNLVNTELPFAERTSKTYLAACGLLGSLALLVPLYHRRWMEFTLGALFLFIPLSTGLQSVPRFLIGNGIFVLILHDILGKGWISYVALALGGVLNLWLIQQWYLAALFLT